MADIAFLDTGLLGAAFAKAAARPGIGRRTRYRRWAGLASDLRRVRPMPSSTPPLPPRVKALPVSWASTLSAGPEPQRNKGTDVNLYQFLDAPASPWILGLYAAICVVSLLLYRVLRRQW